MSAAHSRKPHRGENKFTRSIILAALALLAAIPFPASAQSGDPVLSFANIAALKAYNTATFGTTVPQALTAGYYLAGDGGGNRFFWSATSSAPDNGGSVIQPATVPPAFPGRWLAVRTSPLNAKTFGAKGDGVVDDSPALTRAILEPGGEVFLPAGIYRLGSTVTLAGLGRSLRGEGENATILKADLAVSPVLQLGDSNIYFQGQVSKLQISRASGNVTSAMTGILAHWFSYSVLEDVIINRQGTALPTSPGLFSLGLTLHRIRIHDALTHIWLRDVAEINMMLCNFGTNGGESIAPNVFLLLDGGTNDVRIKTSQFIPRINPNSTVAVKWINSPVTSTGYYRFEDINIENVATGFQSDSTAALVVDLQVTNSRLTTSGKVFDFAPTTSLYVVAFQNNSISTPHQPCTITNAGHSRFVNNHINGGLTFNGGSLNILGNTLTTNVAFTGNFGLLIANDNSLVFNQSAPITFDLSGASGKMMVQDNAADAGTQPERRTP
jgi:hypothetical protein